MPRKTHRNRRGGERRGIITAPRDPSARDKALHVRLVHIMRGFGYIATSLRKQSPHSPDPELTRIAGELGESSLLIWDARRPDDQVRRDVEFASEQRMYILVLHPKGWQHPFWWKNDVSHHYNREFMAEVASLRPVGMEKIFYLTYLEDPATVAAVAKWISGIIAWLRRDSPE